MYRYETSASGKCDLEKISTNVESLPVPRKLLPKKEGERRGRPRTGRVQFTVRFDPDTLTTLAVAGKLFRYIELIATGNYRGLDRATPMMGKVLELLVREYVDQWMSTALERLINSGIPEEVSERLRREFSKHFPPDRETSSELKVY
jgi:hypothetical protein